MLQDQIDQLKAEVDRANGIIDAAGGIIGQLDATVKRLEDALAAGNDDEAEIAAITASLRTHVDGLSSTLPQPAPVDPPVTPSSDQPETKPADSGAENTPA